MTLVSHESLHQVRLPSARRWELEHGPTIVEWLHSSGVADRMFDDVCHTVEALVARCVGDNTEAARRVLEQFPQVLSKCDSLSFNELEQALAYVILHLPDRYGRMFQVLEQILINGALPLGKNENFSVLDIGAGPGPGIFAVRSFYAALARWAQEHAPTWKIATLGHAHVVERSHGMAWAINHFAEQLIAIELGIGKAEASHPCAAELAASATPFHPRHVDFKTLDIYREHHKERQRMAQLLYDEYDSDLNWQEAHQLAYREPISSPSGYSLVLMLNFLTTTDSTSTFADSIQRLMHNSLRPGGVVLTLGAIGQQYVGIYNELDRRALAANLRIVDGFSEPLRAGSRIDELAKVRETVRRIWRRLEERAGDVSKVKNELHSLRSADIFDESLDFKLPLFKVRPYRRGK